MGSQRVSRQAFRKLLSMWNVSDYCVTQHPHWTACLTVPGLSYDSFHFHGVPKIHSLMNLSSTLQLYAFMTPYNQEGDTFMDWQVLTRHCFVFVSTTKLAISKDLYDKSVPKHVLAAKLYQGYVGHSSCSAVSKFYDPSGEEPLFQHLNHAVAVDKCTHQPVPLPDWFKAKYQNKGVINEPFIVTPLPLPKDTYVHKIQVQWSDTDVYLHTNYTAYTKFAIDGVHAALLSQHKHGCAALGDFTDSILLNGLKEVEICYLRQSVHGDKLEIHVWQLEGDLHNVVCSIRCGGEEICQVKLQYFDRG